MELTLEQKKWTEAIKPYIATRVKNGESFEDALKGGIEDYTAILDEGYEMKSDRMRTVRRILGAVVFADCHKIGALEIANGNQRSECLEREL